MPGAGSPFTPITDGSGMNVSYSLLRLLFPGRSIKRLGLGISGRQSSIAASLAESALHLWERNPNSSSNTTDLPSLQEREAKVMATPC